MNNQHQTPPSEAGIDGHPPASISISRRTVLQLTGGVMSLSAVPPAEAQSIPPTVMTGGAVGPLRLVVNGMARELQVDPRQSLLDALRESLGLTGTKKGCNQGACGACTILVNGRRILSCLTLASMHDGAEIETIEGLEKNGELHPLQEAFVEHEGLQCGFCTPGQIMSGLGCIAEGHAGSPDEIRFWMSGNICRCGAYPGIVAAIADAAGRS
ncbi:xanthine dehydrogenase YagT iron-sulfur-binding subunit [Rhizobium mesoamericanum]|uniref:(2Fe-2S)-binding protein n=1 Tax=Rhizobium mesoamericanum TaxID=1079800 RepID=UPI00277EC088|nr:(2Fe-2S)-binding protein [Rhizobium mesoamericanum]MDQ0564322.1 xanthine dehydrogenase YagT iron-sulfur-binding subunit [Rhizobium mesoamericanum]